MKKKLLLATLTMGLLFTISTVRAQIDYKISANAGGVMHHSKVFDGYYYSFEVGITVFDIIEISPTFMGISMSDKEYASFSWQAGDNYDTYSYGVPSGGPKEEIISSDVVNSVGLMIYLKTFWFQRISRIRQARASHGSWLHV